VTSVEDNYKVLDTFKVGTNQWAHYPYGYTFNIEWMDYNVEFNTDRFGKSVLEARRRSDIGGGISVKADCDAMAIINLKHRKEIDATLAVQPDLPMSSSISSLKRSAADSHADLDSTDGGSPDKKKQKKAKNEVEITEAIQLPIRLRLVNKGSEYWCQLESVDSDQEVKSILLENSMDPNMPSQRFPNLSAAAKHVTGLETANGWKKWYFNYRGKWCPIGCFRRPGSTPRLNHDFKDLRIKPRGKGFINVNGVDDPSNLNALLQSASQSSPLDFSPTKETGMVRCLLTLDDKKKMFFFPEEKLVIDMLYHVKNDFGDNVVLTVDGYDVDSQAKLTHLATPSDDGKPIVTGVLKQKHTSMNISNMTNMNNMANLSSMTNL